MFTFMFMILLLMIFGRIFLFALRAAWGVSKIVVSVFLFPVILIGMVLAGLMSLALPILVIVGIVVLFGSFVGQ